MSEDKTKRTQGRSLELYFIDGKPDGMLTAEVFNWAGHVLMTPRTKIVTALKREEAARTGIYLLIGEKDDEPALYIGEAETIRQRFKDHILSKDWWTTAIIVTAAGDGLHKAHVKYLESRLVEIANNVGNGNLVNGNKPTRSSLSEAHAANMETFLDMLLMVLPALRIDAFIDKRRSQKDTATELGATEGPIFELANKRHGLLATAFLYKDEFVIRKGSLARLEWEGNTEQGNNYYKLHENLIGKGVLAINGDTRIFTTDYAFSSTSAAGAVVNGRSTRGPTDWKIKGTSKTYRDWEMEQVAAKDTPA